MFFIRQTEDGYKASLRCLPRMMLPLFARLSAGGGHKLAAGCSIQGTRAAGRGPAVKSAGRGFAGMNGVINVYKEPGWTSGDVVNKLKGVLHERRIGHAGTLDPDA